MIGQRNLRENICHLIGTRNFPRFSIIVGSKGSGKHTLVEYIHEMLEHNEHYEYVQYGIGIDEVRKAIDMAYRSRNNLYITFPDADKMSNAAKNAMLKVMEEPPNNAIFIMTLENVDNTLDTIRSRASIFSMEPYSNKEIEEYYDSKYVCKDAAYREMLFSLAEVPGEIDLLESIDGGGKADKFYEYVELVVDNIAEVQGSNAFKIADKVAVKESSEGYDLRLFLKAFMNICLERMQEDPRRYAAGVSITSTYLQQLSIRGVSKQMLIDAWILGIRKEWMA